jgi:hypothetical protein
MTSFKPERNGLTAKKTHRYRVQHDAHVQVWGAQMVTRVNLMSGKEYQERRDTPVYLSPARESYWSS